jgi:thymidylate synthase
MYNLETINATTLPDAWYQCIYKCIEKGRDFKIDRGSYEGQKRLEFDYITIQIKHPEMRPLLPEIPEQYNIPNPVKEGYLEDYLPYLMTGELKEGESYTYGQRLTNSLLHKDWVDKLTYEYEDILIQEKDVWGDRNIVKIKNAEYYLNQIELCIWTYKNKGFRNNQMVLQVAQPSDILLQDPPCLRHIDTRIQDNKLHFVVYFRSWDLWGGLPSNLGAIQLLKEYMAGEIGVEPGETIASSKGLHIYDYVFELGEILRGKTIEEFRKV